MFQFFLNSFPWNSQFISSQINLDLSKKWMHLCVTFSFVWPMKKNKAVQSAALYWKSEDNLTLRILIQIRVASVIFKFLTLNWTSFLILNSAFNLSTMVLENCKYTVGFIMKILQSFVITSERSKWSGTQFSSKVAKFAR